MSEEKDCTDDLMECVTECDTDDKECKDTCIEEYNECVIPEEKPQPKVNKEEIKKLVKKYKDNWKMVGDGKRTKAVFIPFGDIIYEIAKLN